MKKTHFRLELVSGLKKNKLKESSEKIYFITGNRGKFQEVSGHLDCEQVDLDLVEIQELDSRAVVEAKLREARSHVKEGDILIEDTSLHFDSMGGFPGPLIKWLEKSMSLEQIASMVEQNPSAIARTIFGLMNEDGNVSFFEGIVRGSIVKPRGSNGFGWDKIFQPEGSKLTFAEMSLQEKLRSSSRAMALKKLTSGLRKKSLS